MKYKTLCNVRSKPGARLGEVRRQSVPTRMDTISNIFFAASGSGDQVFDENGRGVATDASCRAHFPVLTRGLKFKGRCLNSEDEEFVHNRCS